MQAEWEQGDSVDGSVEASIESVEGPNKRDKKEEKGQRKINFPVIHKAHAHDHVS